MQDRFYRNMRNNFDSNDSYNVERNKIALRNRLFDENVTHQPVKITKKCVTFQTKQPNNNMNFSTFRSSHFQQPTRTTYAPTITSHYPTGYKNDRFSDKNGERYYTRNYVDKKVTSESVVPQCEYNSAAELLASRRRREHEYNANKSYDYFDPVNVDKEIARVDRVINRSQRGLESDENDFILPNTKPRYSAKEKQQDALSELRSKAVSKLLNQVKEEAVVKHLNELTCSPDKPTQNALVLADLKAFNDLVDELFSSGAFEKRSERKLLEFEKSGEDAETRRMLHEKELQSLQWLAMQAFGEDFSLKTSFQTSFLNSNVI